MAIKTPDFAAQDIFSIEYFLYVNVDGRRFTITTKPKQRGLGTEILTPFVDEEERQLFVNFAQVFFGLANQSTPLERMVQKPQGILQTFWWQKLENPER